MSKNLQPITKPDYLPKFHTWYANVKGDARGISKEARLDFCSLSLRYVDEVENCWSLEALLDAFGIPTKTYISWRNTFPEIKELHEDLKRKIGIRRERAAIEGVGNEKTLIFPLGHYSKTWRYEEDRKAFLSALAAQTIAAAKDGKFDKEFIDDALTYLKDEGYDFGDDPALTKVRSPKLPSKTMGRLSKAKP